MDEPGSLRLPTDLLPDRLGYHWGMPLDSAVFPESYDNALYQFTIVERSIADVNDKFTLFFDEHGLGCIARVAHGSCEFWEERDEMEAIGEQFNDIYQRLVAETISQLGIPDLSDTNCPPWDYATEDGPHHTKWLGDWYHKFAVWKCPNARFQIGVQKEDTELPYILVISAMRPS